MISAHKRAALLLQIFASAFATVVGIHVAAAGSAKTQTSSHQIKGFRYTTCQKSNQCIVIESEKADMSFVNFGGFTTLGRTRFQRLLADGTELPVIVADRVSYNPTLDLVTLENEDGRFALYSLKDEKLSSFGLTPAGGAR